MKISEENYTITTIYFDGQFWCAMIEKNVAGQNFSGRYVFGEEPSNPRLLNWMLYEFAKIKLLPINENRKIRFKKLAKRSYEAKGVPKSLKAFSAAQKEYAENRKSQKRKQKKFLEEEKYLLKREKKRKKR